MTSKELLEFIDGLAQSYKSIGMDFAPLFLYDDIADSFNEMMGGETYVKDKMIMRGGVTFAIIMNDEDCVFKTQKMELKL